MFTIARRQANRKCRLSLLLILSAILGAATACALSGCNTIARVAVAAVQGAGEDLASASRHAGQQSSHAAQDAENERRALDGQGGGR